MAQAAIKRGARYTYADYLTWSDGERWELIHGVAYNMTPAPGRRHEEITVELVLQFGPYLKGKGCKVFTAPFDVRLPSQGESDETTTSVVQPDLLVVCDPAKLDDRGCKGAPDLVIEILSLHTSSKDLKEKFLLYESAGVEDYWVVHPAEQTVLVFRRGADGKYDRPERYTSDDRVRVGFLPQLEIDLGVVFAE